MTTNKNNGIEEVRDYLIENSDVFSTTYLLRKTRDDLNAIMRLDDTLKNKRDKMIKSVAVNKTMIKTDEIVEQEQKLKSHFKRLFFKEEDSYMTTADRNNEQQHISHIYNLLVEDSISNHSIKY